MSQDKTLGYAEFVELFAIHGDPEEWQDQFAVCKEGVFVRLPPTDVQLFSAERAELARHPSGDLTKPALAFPFSWSELRGFMDFYRIREVDGLHLLNRLLESGGLLLKKSKRAESTDLRIIGALLTLMTEKGDDGTRPAWPSEAKIIGLLTSRFPGFPGMGESTLKARFAVAKTELQSK